MKLRLLREHKSKVRFFTYQGRRFEGIIFIFFACAMWFYFLFIYYYFFFADSKRLESDLEELNCALDLIASEVGSSIDKSVFTTCFELFFRC